MKRPATVALIALLLILLIVFAIRTEKTQELTYVASQNEITTTMVDIKEKIRQQGLVAVYDQIESQYKGTPKGHVVDHFVGDYIFDEYGLNGVLECRSTFTSGCTHQVINHYFSQEGLSGFEAVVSACNGMHGAKKIGCLHGLGHALLEYRGGNAMAEVLSLCQKADGQVKPYGCVGGVFMEYFFPSIYTLSQEPPVKVFREDQAFDQCLSLPLEFQRVCIHGLVEWWEVVFSHDYVRMNGLCGALQVQDVRRACFSTVGSLFAYYREYDTKEAISFCEKLDSQDDQMSCVSGVMWILGANTGMSLTEVVDRYCAGQELMSLECGKRFLTETAWR